MPYTSEVEGNIKRVPCSTHIRTMGKFASKSNSNTFKGLSTYICGLAIAIKGNTQSASLTCSSIHSYDENKSAFTKVNRGCSSCDSILCESKSNPTTVQSVVANIASNKCEPINPLTPNINTRMLLILLLCPFDHETGTLSHFLINAPYVFAYNPQTH